jgi:TetR/AcrR family transcriptional regulator, fatty acid metabolism regulator protein
MRRGVQHKPIYKSVNACYEISGGLAMNSLNKKERQNLIFDAACRVIREKGFHQARITDIAQRAGISYGLVYHYFKNKSDLFDFIIDQWWTGLFSSMEKADRSAESVESKLGSVIDYFLDQYEKKPDLVHIFITEISRSVPNLTPERLKWIKIFLERTEKIIIQAQSDGILRYDVKARYLTYIFIGALENFISAMVLEKLPLRGQNQKKRIAEGLLEVFLNGARSERVK